MTEKELKELFDKLKQAGAEPQLCDTPVPYFRNGVPAGYLKAPGDYDGETVMVPRSLLKECDFIVHVNGDSMKDVGIEDGDDVIVKDYNVINDGDIVVALLDGESTLKAYCRYDDGTQWLVPANKDYKPICLNDYETVYILGRVTRITKPQPHASFSSMQHRLKEAIENKKPELTDDDVRQAVQQVLERITAGPSRLWFCIYRVLVDATFLSKGHYDGLKVCMDRLFPHNTFDINPRDLSRLDVGSFSKHLSLWNEANAPVKGKRYHMYKQLALDFAALLS